MTAPHPLLAELHRIRREGGWTLDRVARALSYGRSSVHHWEVGTRVPNLAAAAAFAEALGYELVLRRRVCEPELVTPGRAEQNRADLAAALGTVDDYKPRQEGA